MKSLKKVFKNHRNLANIMKQISSLKAKIEEELKKIKFRAKPAFIIILTLFILIIPRYHQYVWGMPEIESAFFLRVVLPIVIILFMFREKLTEYGLGLGNKKQGFYLSLFFLICYIPFFLILSRNESFIRYYLPMVNQIESFKAWTIFEVNSFFYLVKDEFIFRGFLLFGLRRDLGGNNAVLIQTIPYSLLHIGKPELECYGSILVGLALGYLALRTRSIWYGLILHWLIGIGLNLAIFYQIY